MPMVAHNQRLSSIPPASNRPVTVALMAHQPPSSDIAWHLRSDDSAAVIFNPAAFDRPQVLTLLAAAWQRPVIETAEVSR